MQTVAVAGASLSTLSLGEGPAVALLHGLALGNMASWYSRIALPLAQRRQVLLYDQRGHGDSSRSQSGYDLATQVDDLEHVLAHYGIARVALAGHSMGALIALAFACRHPQRVERLCLLDAPWPAARWIAPSLHTDVQAADLARVLDAGLSLPPGRRRERLYARLQALLQETSLVAAVQAMHGEEAACFPRLHMPLRLLYGRRSPCRAAADSLLAHLPAAQLVEVEGGHYLLEEAPAEVEAQLQDFLAAEAKDGS